MSSDENLQRQVERPGRGLTGRIRRLPPWGEFVVIFVVCFGPIISASLMSNFRGTHLVVGTNSRILRLLLIELLATLAVLSILHLRGSRPLLGQMRVSLLSTGSAALLFVAVHLFSAATSLLVYFTLGSPSRSRWFQFVHHESWWVAIPVFVFNAFFEERFVTGYLVDALQKYGALVAIGLSTLTRLSYHSYQGLDNMMRMMPMGILFGVVYWRKRNLYPLILAHAAINTMLFWQWIAIHS